MNMKPALLLLAVSLTACATRPRPPHPIPAVAERRQCAPYPLPPEALTKPPVKTDFLTPTD